MKKNRILAIVLTLLYCLSLFALPVFAEEEEEEVWTVPEPKPVLLAVSFGTSYNENRALTIGAMETAFAEAFPEYEIRRAFTSQIIIDKLHARDGERIDNVEQAMYRLLADGIKEVLVVPTHVMPGFEYEDVVAEISPFADKFESLKVSRPMLDTDEDFLNVLKIVTAHTAEYDVEGNAIVFMGHGTEHKANEVYGRFDALLKENGFSRYFVGTVEGTPTLEDVVAKVKEGNYSKVVLLPFMIVAGDHANNDMAGDEEDSWKSVFEAEGYETEAVLAGMGSYEEIHQLFIEHAQAASEVTAVQEEEKTESAAENKAVILDGEYEIEVESSSNMFNIVSAKLIVKDGVMKCAMTMSGKGYLKLFMGTAEEAAAAPEEQMIPFEEDAEGAHVFTVPVAELDQEINCAAFSKKKEQWYDRVLVFSAKMLPVEAFAQE